MLFWSWFWLVLFIAVFISIAFYGLRRTKTAEDFAVARSSYGPVTIAFAIAATTASGSTFLGMPGLAYKLGFPAIWYPALYPLATYVGLILCVFFLKKMGDKFRSNSLPEFIGQRYKSDTLRILFSLISLLLIYYIVAQLVAAATIFQIILDVDYIYGLLITVFVVGFYISVGGSHSDIMTDFVQGILMVLIALLIGFTFFSGLGLADGGGAVEINRLIQIQDPSLSWDNYFSEGHPIFGSALLIILMVIAHLPFALNPHIGNKIFALRSDKDIKKLIILLVPLGSILGMTVFGGIHARALLGPGIEPDAAIPSLFTSIFPPFIASFLGVAILSAILSTSDGLFVTLSVIFSNDIYRKTLAPIFHKHKSSAEIDKIALWISRIAILVICLVTTLMALNRPKFLSILLWIGVGGIMSATAGPLLIGALWKRATRIGALVSFFTGVSLYIILYVIVGWNNPFGVAGVGVLAGASTMIVVSLLTNDTSKKITKVGR